ncbi:L-fucose:H+ symporter permease [Pseudoflavitalea sp. G-6-1-2]|uniref:L-fucose:H+ symporter permease n=1 Tax=Pseudoflavitalea sp. G-6-1-2 TaxID=2728841 RepID=UPI001469CF20|nr:L-fucose:H+ symporter permease [Pseudoflavitalea sp. G-6-1-2]NML22210.1 L-fucose:H+ symporter permease [Pseudoflavitalea sp. G-6-1-2]
MAIASPTQQTNISAGTGKKLLLPFILVTSLFFLWGFAYGLLDVLNKHFQEALNITKMRSTLLQGAYFGAYFLMALPAGWVMKKRGYKFGIIMGLCMYALGALLFYPAAVVRNFDWFLIALFILAAGLTFLETAANPYVTVLGPPSSSTFRLNLSQSFNGVGSFFGPIIGGKLFFNEGGNTGGDLSNVSFVYLVITFVVLAIALMFYLTKLPEIREEGETAGNNSVPVRKLWSYSHFTWSVVAQFFYVAAQVGVGALFINYATHYGKDITNAQAAYLLSIALLLFTIGRFVGTALMKRIPANVLLTVYAIINILLCAVIVYMPGQTAVYALMVVFFFMSIMFPTIFALGVKDLGAHTKRASGFIIMSIVGGALVPPVMGLISEKSLATSFIVPLLCFAVVALFGWKGYKVKSV